ncbi:asparagine synthase-related protein [Streptomyces antimicrobicus]|uniref:asparagine synthase (glutamine-hydrolyzing) n=1 Tax=Streptomyces antimicrobicus TaxID=2883108 RepID=A0ABS8BC43_9ACTN|nr:asparagine synthase-related protein [Streptomyces antimicrobicus]MCB5182192.1 asparagine synthetase B family protein [Streptomyces antimicrobicus]
MPFFFAFSDCEAAEAVARRLCADRPGLGVVPHGSGRPWIVGHWPDASPLVVRHRDNAVALVGSYAADEAELARRTRAVRTPTDLDALAASLPGQFHVVAAVAGHLRVQGTAYGTRRVFHGRTGSVVVAADRAAELAALLGAPVDTAQLALRLFHPVPAPLDQRALWHGVEAVPPGSALVVTEGRTARTHRWHRPPEPHLGAAEGATAVREALRAGVALRTTGGGLISADLSGGMDSTAICFLAAGRLRDTRLIACTSTGDETENEDGHWARLAARALPDTEHLVIGEHELPLFYDGVLDDRDRWDAPSPFAVSRNRATALVARMAARGSRLHLTGIGGDHLFFGGAVHYHSLLTRRPWLALSRLRGYRTLYAWPRREVLRELADRRGYREAFAGLTVRTSGSLSLSRPGFGWMHPLVVAPWFTPDCLDTAERVLADAAGSVRPYAADRARHVELAAVYSGTQDVRAYDDAARQAGVPVAHPFFDDHVVDAALSVRPEDRATPWAYKPLLARAMTGIVPERNLTRSTKGDGTPDAVAGLHRHREELAALWEDSALAEAGLVDPGRLRRLCLAPGSPELADNALYSTLACESWLRTARRAVTASPGRST